MTPKSNLRVFYENMYTWKTDEAQCVPIFLI